MTKEQLINLCDIWIINENIDEFDEIEMRPVAFILEHAGRYSLEMHSKDCFPKIFSNYLKSNIDDKYVSELYVILTSPDENYYYGIFESKSRLAYDVALFGKALRNHEPVDGIADAFALVFEAISKRDYQALEKALIAGGITIKDDGMMEMNDIPDIIGSFTVFPSISMKGVTK